MGFDIAPYSGAISAVSGMLDTIFKRVLPAEKMSEKDRETLKAQVASELEQLDWAALAAQIGVNLAEAQSEHLFVSGWRPFVGWVCGGAFAYSFVLQPFIAFSVGVFKWQLPPLPTLDVSALLTILLGMLGLAGARTYEKIRGVSNSK